MNWMRLVLYKTTRRVSALACTTMCHAASRSLSTCFQEDCLVKLCPIVFKTVQNKNTLINVSASNDNIKTLTRKNRAQRRKRTRFRSTLQIHIDQHCDVDYLNKKEVPRCIQCVDQHCEVDDDEVVNNKERIRRGHDVDLMSVNITM